MGLSKAHSLVGVASRGTVEIGLDERSLSAMLLEAMEHFQ